MAGGPTQFPDLPGAQCRIYFLQRAEKAGKALFQFGRASPAGLKIPVTKLVGAGNYGCSHGPVLMGSLGPGEAILRIDPDSKSHLSVSLGGRQTGWCLAHV